jgi:hypothetical protein
MKWHPKSLLPATRCGVFARTETPVSGGKMKDTMAHWLIAGGLWVGICAIAPTSQAEVIVTWKQVGNDVTATWSGTLATDASLMNDTSANILGVTRANSTQLIASSSSATGPSGQFGSVLEDPAGTVTATSLNAPNNSITAAPSGFGFRDSTLSYNSTLITGGSLGAVSELTFDPGTHVFTFANTTLADIGADSFSDTLAWTATTTGDTISYNTFSETSDVALADFTYDPADGSAEVTIEGAENTTYTLVEADDLDFSNPDQTITPTGVTPPATLDGNEITTDGSGNATVQFNLGNTKDATFLRAEEAP